LQSEQSAFALCREQINRVSKESLPSDELLYVQLISQPAARFQVEPVIHAEWEEALEPGEGYLQVLSKRTIRFRENRLAVFQGLHCFLEDVLVLTLRKGFKIRRFDRDLVAVQLSHKVFLPRPRLNDGEQQEPNGLDCHEDTSDFSKPIDRRVNRARNFLQVWVELDHDSRYDLGEFTVVHHFFFLQIEVVIQGVLPGPDSVV
jgi:hypothetical protein